MNLGKRKGSVVIPFRREEVIPAPNWPRRQKEKEGIPAPNWPKREKVPAK